MLQRFREWLRFQFGSAFSEAMPPKEPLMPPEYFRPPRHYNDDEVNLEVILHNHMEDEYFHRTQMGHGLNRIFEEIGGLRGEVGILKKLVIPAAVGGLVAFMTLKVVPALSYMGGF